MFETIGRFDQDTFFESLVGDEDNDRKIIKNLTDLIVPLNHKIGSDTILNAGRSRNIGYPRWGDNHENYTYPEPETAAEYAHNTLLGHIASEHGVKKFSDGYSIEQAEGRARVAVDAVRLWEHVNQEVPCVFQSNKDEKLAMTAAQQYGMVGTQAPTPVQLFEMAIPSLVGVPWGRIIELRRNGLMDSLRDKMGAALEQAGTDLNAAKTLLSKVEQDAMDTIVERSRPRPRKVVLEAILANIPKLPANPFSLYYGTRDTVSAMRMKKEFGWLYLLRDIRDAGEMASRSVVN